MSTAKSQDDPDARPPPEFASSSGAMVYGLAMFACRRPAHFYLGLCGVVSFPAYLLIHLAGYLHGLR